MFDEARTRPVLADVCDRLGYPSEDAVLLRHHTNAVYAVKDVVIKIAPSDLSLARVRAVVDLVRWLVVHGFSTVGLYPDLPQPLMVGGHAITVWQRLDPAHDKRITAAELGALLRELHALPVPPVDLPALRPVESIRRSISRTGILGQTDRELLWGRLDTLTTAWSTMRFPLRTSLIQSDPQAANALRRADGTAVLADWDAATIGPPEWDVATVAVHCRRFAHPGPAAFADFVTAYGWDPTSWHSFEQLCQLRELQMIATNARKSHPGGRAAAEVHHRIAGLREDSTGLRQWRIL